MLRSSLSQIGSALRPQASRGFKSPSVAGHLVLSPSVLGASLHGIYHEFLKHINETNFVSYESHTKTKVEIESSVRKFICEGNVAWGFLLKCCDVFASLTSDDVKSIATGTLTKNAKDFVDLFNYLESNIFVSVKDLGRDVAFWSGAEAEKAILAADDLIADSQLSSVKFMLSLIAKINYQMQVENFNRNPNHDNIQLLIYAVSAYYASNASDKVHIYLSSNDSNRVSGFTEGNYFWNAELPVLLNRYNQGLIKEIHVHLYDHETKTWTEKNLFSIQAALTPTRRFETQDVHWSSEKTDAPVASGSFVELLLMENPELAQLYIKGMKEYQKVIANPYSHTL